MLFRNKMVLAAMVGSMTLMAGVASSSTRYPRLQLYEVNALQDGGFEVIGRAGDGGRQYWCIAALHARLKLGAKNNERLYLARGIGDSVTKSGHRGISFTIHPDNAVKASGGGAFTASIRAVGANLTVNHANSFCNTGEGRDYDFGR